MYVDSSMRALPSSITHIPAAVTVIFEAGVNDTSTTNAKIQAELQQYLNGGCNRIGYHTCRWYSHSWWDRPTCLGDLIGKRIVLKGLDLGVLAQWKLRYEKSSVSISAAVLVDLEALPINDPSIADEINVHRLEYAQRLY